MGCEIKNLILELNSICNCDCVYCYLHNRKDKGMGSFEYFKDKIKEFAAKGTKNIDFTGGEPTLYPYLRELIREARKQGFENLNLITNGIKLSDIEFCKKIIPEGITRVIVSVDGPNSEVCETITNLKGSFDYTMQALENLKVFNCKIGATVVVNKFNYFYIEDIFSVCMKKGVDFFNVQYMLPYIKDKHVDCRVIPPEVIPTYNETLPYLRAGLEKFKDKIKTNVHFIPFCYMEGYEDLLYMEADKEDRYAVNYRGFGYNIGGHLLKDTVKTEKCRGCRYENYCIGFFQSYAKELGIENEIKNKGEGFGGKNKTLFFRNLFVSPDGKENNNWFHQATFFLASSLSLNGKPIAISNTQFSNKEKNNFSNKEELDELLDNNPDINLIVITLLENCFEQTRELIKYLKSKSSAFVVVGGIMPTLTPYHVFEHLSEADIVIKGEGEFVLPQIQEILNGRSVIDGIDKDVKNKLKKVKGVLFREGEGWLISNDFSDNVVENLDELELDFSLFKKENVEQGLNLSTSRGCHNYCFFCTVPNRRVYRTMSADNLKSILEDYHKRLLEIYGNQENIPPDCFLLSFNDDDFLGNRERAIAFFNYIKKTKFRINFIQASITSFFCKDNENVEKIDKKLIRTMASNVFFNNRSYKIYIGTENFSNDELKRLGKNYDFSKVTKVTAALSHYKIRHAHHMILTNIETSLENLIENLLKISILRKRFGKYFNLLLPVTSSLVSFYPSLTYKIFSKKYGHKYFKINRILKSQKDIGLDYPLISYDIPKDPDVFSIACKAHSLIREENDYISSIEKTLIFFLNQSEYLKLSGGDENRIKKLDYLIDNHNKFHQTIKNSLPEEISKEIFTSNKNNIQIMLTRRCQLRCEYCPIPKKELDMEWDVLKRTVDMVLDSAEQDEVRIDFSGGEPLLRFDLLKRIIEYAIERGKDVKKEVSFYIVTNSLLLKEEVIDFLDNKNVLLELSIDGDERTHNKYKIPKENRNPYQETIKNVKKLKGRNINYFVVIVATLDTVDYLFENFKHVLSLGFTKFEFNYAIGMYWEDERINKFIEQLDKIIMTYKNEIFKGEIEIGNLFKRNEPAVLNKEFMIDTNGDIRFLNEFLFKADKVNPCPYELPNVMNCDFKELYVDKFMVYYSIVKMFSNDEKIRQIISNNIKIGLKVKKYISKIKPLFIKKKRC